MVNVEEGIAILRALVDFLLEHAKLVDNILDSSMSGMMLLMIEDRVAEIFRERYHAHAKARGEDPLAFAAAKKAEEAPAEETAAEAEVETEAAAE